jgi:hypothetical protein
MNESLLTTGSNGKLLGLRLVHDLEAILTREDLLSKVLIEDLESLFLYPSPASNSIHQAVY